MGVMVHSLLWVMQELYHQPYLYLRSRCGVKDYPSSHNTRDPSITTML